MQIEGKLEFVFGIANQMFWMNMAFLSLVCFLRLCIDETSCYVVWKKEPLIQKNVVSLRQPLHTPCPRKIQGGLQWTPCWVVIAMALIRLRHSETVSSGFPTKESGLIDTVQVVHSTQSALYAFYLKYILLVYFPLYFLLLGWVWSEKSHRWSLTTSLLVRRCSSRKTRGQWPPTLYPNSAQRVWHEWPGDPEMLCGFRSGSTPDFLMK